MERNEGPQPSEKACDSQQNGDVRAQVERMAASPMFASAPRRIRLLKYLLERTLEGPGEQVNEYSIGLDVMGKLPSFDPRSDSMVRTEVMRLRQRLRSYYVEEGQADSIVLDLPARSYRIAIEFRSNGGAAGPEVSMAATALAAAEAPPRARRKRMWLLAAAVVFAAVAISVAVRTSTSGAPSQRIQSLVVLPFQDDSPDRRSGYLADGLTDELTNSLANLGGLQVISRTSAFEYKGRNVDIREVGRQLNVQTALEGSVVREGARIRIRAQLTRTSDGYDLWSRAYDIDSPDLIGVQRQIAQSIADDLKLKQSTLNRLQAGAQRGGLQGFTNDPQANELYMRAMEALNTDSAEAVKNAAGLFRAALDRDRNFAMAWLGLARAHDAMQSAGARDVPFEEIESEARHALDLDPGLAGAHETLAIVAWERDHDWPETEREFRLAIADGGGGSSRSNAIYGFHLAERGRFAESHERLRVAQELSPLESLPLLNEAWVYLFERKYDQSEAEFLRIIATHPDNTMALTGLGWLQTLRGNCDGAAATAGKIAGISPDAFLTKSVIWNVAVCRGQVQEALRQLDSAAPTFPAMQTAMGYARLGEREKALAYLDKAVTVRDIAAPMMGVLPSFDALHGDPRFVAIERRAGLDPK
jgi:serine/threonine-protein kinase